MSYLRNVRVQRARGLLSDPSLSIKQVARRAGFSDAYVFSKTFRRVDGLTPTAFRHSRLTVTAPPDAAQLE